jgi:uncharacterized protein YuzE
MFAYYDPDVDIAWFPTGESNDVVSARSPGGLREYDRTTDILVAIEVWDASTRLPRTLLEALPSPVARRKARRLSPGDDEGPSCETPRALLG